MERITEKELVRYVVATLNPDGRAMYLRSLHGGNYDLVEDIEYATKLCGKSTARAFYRIACQDLGPHIELVLIPLIIMYQLVKEVD